MATFLRSALVLAGATLLGACAVAPYDYNDGYHGNPGYYGGGPGYYGGAQGYYGAPGPYYEEPGYGYVEPSIGFGIGFSDRGDHWRDRRDWRDGHERRDRDHDHDH